MSSGAGPDPDLFSLDRVGRGRPFGRRAGTALERREGSAWVTVARYPDRLAASNALDTAIAEGGAPGDYRLITSENTGFQRSILIASSIMAVLVAYSLWQIIR